MVILLDRNCQILSILGLRHHEEVWDYAPTILNNHPEDNLYIAIVDVLQDDWVRSGPNLWDAARMNRLGRIAAKKESGKVSFVDRGYYGRTA